MSLLENNLRVTDFFFFFLSSVLNFFNMMLSDRTCEEPERGAEPEAGPSGHQPSRQGYCGYCRLLYSNLDQVAAPFRSADPQWPIRLSSTVTLCYFSTCQASNTWSPPRPPPKSLTPDALPPPPPPALSC